MSDRFLAIFSGLRKLQLSSLYMVTA